MASSPSQRLIFSPTLVCVKLQSVVAIHLIHLALDLAGAALCRCSVCETHPSWAEPRAPGTRSVRMGKLGTCLPPSSGPCSREEAGNLLEPVLTVLPTPTNQQCLRLYKGFLIGNLMDSCTWDN